MLEIIGTYDAHNISIELLIIVFIVSLVAETYGSIFGGGGFLIQPVMIALGIPPHQVVANDVAACSGTALSGAYVFRKNKYVLFDLVKWWLPGILIGPIIGAQLLYITPAWLVEKLIAVFCISGSAYILLFKGKMNNGDGIDLPEKWKIRSIFLSLVVGVYFGFSGAGVGILTSLILYGIFGLSLRNTLGTRKFIHLPIHIISAISYYFLGLINWPIFLSMFSGCLVAGWIGSTIAIKVSERVLKPIFFSVILLLSVWILI